MKWVCLIFLISCAGLARADLPDTVARIKPSVVAVGTFLPTRNPQFKFYGTGFAVADGRLIATNAHVLGAPLEDRDMERWAIALPADAERIEVRLATLIARDAKHDIALLAHQGKPLPPLTLRQKPALVREGETLSFTGYPIGAVLGLFPVTHRALVSALSPIAIPHAEAKTLSPRDIQRLSQDPWTVIQLDATAYPGSSGSPLFDPQTGEVVGVVNMVFIKGSRESALSQPSGITFAVPIAHLIQLLAR
jgi:S1-C subfamily serine protease